MNATADRLKPFDHGERAGLSTAAVVGRSFSFRLIAQFLSAFVNVVGMVVLGNYLAADGYGRYAFYYALIPLISSLTDLGVGVIITRQIARLPDLGPRYLGDALMIKGVLAAAIMLVVGITAPMVFDPAHVVLVLLVTATAILDLGQDVGAWIFRAHDRQDLEAILLMASQILWIGGIVLCAALRAPLEWLIGTATLAFVVRMTLGVLVARRLLYRPRFEWDRARLMGIVREGLPFGVAMFCVLLYGRSGVILLKGMATDADVAYFNMGYMFSQPLGFISSAFNVAVFPTLARLASQGPEAVRPTLRNAAKFQFMAALPLSAGLFLLSGRVVPMLLHHGNFQQTGTAMAIIALGLAPIFLNLMSRYVLTALDRQWAYLRAILAGLVVNVGVTALLIRPFGFRGACVGLLCGETAVLLVCQHTLGAFLPFADLVREAVKPFIAALGMAIVVYLLRGLNLFLLPPIGAVVYVTLLLVLRALSTEELAVIRSVYVSFRLPGSAWLAGSGGRS